MKIYYSALLGSLILFGCTTSEVVQKENKSKQEDEEIATVIEPMSFDAGADTYTVSATEADTIFAPTGSTILFEPNSFVDADGNAIKVDVKVKWQEFHSLGDIIASGIPMKYDSAGVAHDLESGGMFTISASHKGKPAEVAPGKSVEVNLASMQDTPCYNFYELDEKSGGWDYKTTKNGEKVEEEASEEEDEVEEEEVEEKDEETITNEGDSNITIINNESIEYPFGLVAVFFEKNKSKVSRSFYTKLEELSSYVEENPNFKIKVSGYADSATGNTSLNQALSIQRVQSVIDVLIEMGVSPDLFEVNPMGETLSFSQSLYDLNRRVDVELIINEE